MCFSLLSSISAVAICFVVSCILFFYYGEPWDKWVARNSFFVMFMQVVDVALWYDHEVYGQDFESCTPWNRFWTGFACWNIHLQLFVQLWSSWIYRGVETGSSLWWKEVAAYSMAGALQLAVCWLSNPCHSESPHWYCSQLSPQNTVNYGWGVDKWGGNKCLRTLLFAGERVQDIPVLLFALISPYYAYFRWNDPMLKRSRLFGGIDFCGWLLGIYFGSKASVWCYFATLLPLAGLFTRWVYPFEKQPRGSLDKVD